MAGVVTFYTYTTNFIITLISVNKEIVGKKIEKSKSSVCKLPYSLRGRHTKGEGGGVKFQREVRGEREA